jgi:hypothetical protein
MHVLFRACAGMLSVTPFCSVKPGTLLSVASCSIFFPHENTPSSIVRLQRGTQVALIAQSKVTPNFRRKG